MTKSIIKTHHLIFTFRQREGAPSLLDLGRQYATLVSQVLNSGKVKLSPILVFPNGLASVNDGFKYMQEGKVRKYKSAVSKTPNDRFRSAARRLSSALQTLRVFNKAVIRRRMRARGRARPCATARAQSCTSVARRI